MESKQAIVQAMEEEFARWDALLGSLSEAEVETTVLPGEIRYGDLACHLWSWQQRSIARMEAALEGREPIFPKWGDTNPDDEDDLEQVNAWIMGHCAEKTWAQAYADWRAGFLRLIELTKQVAERDLLEQGKYPWLWGEALSLIPMASVRHHNEEHYGPLMAWREKRLSP